VTPADILILIRLIVRVVMIALALACFSRTAHADEPAIYVGGQVCSGCHVAESERWKGSHHALAMQKATEATVLGDFSGAQLKHLGVTTIFFRNGDRFMVRSDGPDGALHEYPIAYTFGVYPLQQYLIPFPGGRLQALGIAWDSRPKEAGGQRWFHLYTDQKLPAGDRLHWTGRDQTWNYQCADCHSTDLRKNYNLATNTYATTWTDVDVSCEACHGPGSRHVGWAKARSDSQRYGEQDRMGLVVWLKPTDSGVWEINPETGIARRSAPLVSAELDSCAACHSRRKVITQDHPPGVKFLDANLPALLEPGFYYADGQIDGEVYEYGSFLQSRMHAAGVNCSNCHDPHSVKLHVEGNALCAQCHFAGAVRRDRSSPSRAQQHRRAMRQLPYAYENLYGRGREARSQHPRPAARPVGFARYAERLHAVPRRPHTGMGGAGGCRMVPARAADNAALRHRASRGPHWSSGRGAAARPADS
jgi:hypothetical protein